MFTARSTISLDLHRVVEDPKRTISTTQPETRNPNSLMTFPRRSSGVVDRLLMLSRAMSTDLIHVREDADRKISITELLAL